MQHEGLKFKEKGGALLGILFFHVMVVFDAKIPSFCLSGCWSCDNVGVEVGDDRLA